MFLGRNGGSSIVRRVKDSNEWTIRSMSGKASYGRVHLSKTVGLRTGEWLEYRTKT